MTRRPRPAETPECRRGRVDGPPRGLSHCAVFGSFEPAPLLRDADLAAPCRERACIAHFHGTAFTRINRSRSAHRPTSGCRDPGSIRTEHTSDMRTIQTCGSRPTGNYETILTGQPVHMAHVFLSHS